MLQVILDQIDGGMSIEDAVAAPRFHRQWPPDRLVVERDGLPLATVSALKAMGYHVQFGAPRAIEPSRSGHGRRALTDRQPMQQQCGALRLHG